MAAQILTVVCAWCDRIVTHGPPNAMTTHTICPECAEWTMACQYDGDAFLERVSARAFPTASYFGDMN